MVYTEDIWSDGRDPKVAVSINEDGDIILRVGDYFSECIASADEKYEKESWDAIADAVAQCLEYVNNPDKYPTGNQFPTHVGAKYMGYVELQGATGGYSTVYIYDCGYGETFVVEDTHDGQLIFRVENEPWEKVIEEYKNATDEKDGFHLVKVVINEN